ncbi:MAG: hypothetical protein DMG64_19105 [Acidobacteria bacterium]|nr:MAG: hypothetical protein DMG64_19105 [Acidobacteriota bacterium]
MRKFTDHSLLFTVLCADQKSRFFVIPDTAGGCVDRPLRTRVLGKKFTVKFADKFTVNSLFLRITAK